MKNRILALATMAGLAFAAGQASAITAVTGVDDGIMVTSPAPENRVAVEQDGSLWFWRLRTGAGTGDIAFVDLTNTSAAAQQGFYTFSILGQSGAVPMFTFSIDNGINIDTSVVQPGFGDFILASGETITFALTGTSAGLTVSGAINFADVPVIPLPAGVFLLLTALGGLAAVRKISKKPELV